MLLLHAAEHEPLRAAAESVHTDSTLSLSFCCRGETSSSFLTFASVSSIFVFGPIGDNRFLCGSAHSPSLNKPN